MVSKIFYFHPYLGKWSNLTNIFQMGWFNHQLVKHVEWYFRVSFINPIPPYHPAGSGGGGERQSFPFCACCRGTWWRHGTRVTKNRGKHMRKTTWKKHGTYKVDVLFQFLCAIVCYKKATLYYIPFQSGCFIGLSIMSYNNPCSINKSSSIALYMIQTTLFFCCSFVL